MSVYCTQRDYTVSIYEQRNFTDNSIVWQIVIEKGSSIKDWVDIEHPKLSGALALLEKWLEGEQK